MSKSYYIASCVFTSQFPELSERIQSYVKDRFGFEIVRCCIPNYQVRDFEGRMPPDYRPKWAALPDGVLFEPGDTAWSLCHNCSNIIEETRPGVNIPSLWELILSDESFPYPDYGGIRVTLQDCWRARERTGEHNAVRELLTRMHIEYAELEDNRDKTEFCGASLYREQPARNPKLAPRHYKDGAAGKFVPHTPDEQEQIMRGYCRRFETDTVVCYCHYCLEGLKMGGVNARHIAQLLFPAK